MKRKMKDPNDYIIEGNITKIGCYGLKGEFKGYAVIDTVDIEKCKPYKWCMPDSYKGYVVAKLLNDSSGVNVRLHNVIMGITVSNDFKVDHISRKRFDNRKENLRICNHSENLCNKSEQQNNTSGYKGVGWQKTQGYWSSKIQKDGIKYHLGFFDDPIEAAKAYNKKALELHGEFAYQNPIESEIKLIGECKVKPSERRQQMKQEMSQRAVESYNNKDDSGKFKSIFIKDQIGNTSKWKCGEGEHFLNIIPFLAGPNHPTVGEGKFAYFLDIWVHGKVGINEDSYVCMARSFNKPCAICDHQNELRKQDDYDEKYVKSLNPGRRAIYNVECLDSNTEIGKKVQYWDASHFSIEKEIAELAKKPRGGGFITFADPDDGKTVFFRRTGTGMSNTKYSAFKFEDRTEPISDELLDLALPLDKCVHLPTYEEVKNAFFGNVIDEGDPQAREEAAMDAALEDTQPINSRVRRSAEPAKEEVKKEAEFECPGNAPDDFNTFEACDQCPDFAECELAFNTVEEAKAAAIKAKEVADATKKPSTDVDTTGRMVRRTPGEAIAEPEKAVETAVEEPTRRVRRRPGQD